MRAFDFDAPHLPLISPGLDHRFILKEGLKAEKTKVHQVVMFPFFDPEWTTTQQFGRHRNVPVVMDDQALVCGDSKVEFNAIKHHHGVAQTLEGVLWRSLPSRDSNHERVWLRHLGEGLPYDRQRRIVVAEGDSSEGIKPTFNAAEAWTPTKS